MTEKLNNILAFKMADTISIRHVTNQINWEFLFSNKDSVKFIYSTNLWWIFFPTSSQIASLLKMINIHPLNIDFNRGIHCSTKCPNLIIEPKYLTKRTNAQLNPNISRTKKGKKDTVTNTVNTVNTVNKFLY